MCVCVCVCVIVCACFWGESCDGVSGKTIILLLGGGGEHLSISLATPRCLELVTYL